MSAKKKFKNILQLQTFKKEKRFPYGSGKDAVLSEAVVAILQELLIYAMSEIRAWQNKGKRRKKENTEKKIVCVKFVEILWSKNRLSFPIVDFRARINNLYLRHNFLGHDHQIILKVQYSSYADSWETEMLSYHRNWNCHVRMDGMKWCYTVDLLFALFCIER